MLVNDTYTQYRPTAYTPCPNQPAFLVNGVVHNLVMQDYNGLPYVFALPQMNGAAFGAAFGAAPPPFFVNNVASSASGHYLVHPATSPQDVQHAYNATSHALAAAAAAAAYGMPPIPGALDPSMAQTPFTAGAAAASAAAAAAAAAAAGRPGEHAPPPNPGAAAGEGAAQPANGGAGAGAAQQGAAAGVAAAGGMGGDMEDEEGRVDGVKLLLKLAFFVYLLGQDGGQQRLFLLSIGALLIFLAQTGRLDFMNRIHLFIPRFTQPLPPPRPPPAEPNADPNAEGGGADGEPGGGGAAAAQEPEPPAEGIAMSLFRDVESIIGAFFASLLPSWRPDDYPDIPPEPQQPMAAGPGANF